MHDGLRNPSLRDLAFLTGEWDMTIHHASFLPDSASTLAGRAEVQPAEVGAALVMRQGVSQSGPPSACWIIGRDETQPHFTVLYADDRGVSRVYEMALEGERWTIWRDDPEFSQRFAALVSPTRSRISGRWEKCVAGGEWEHDFNLDYTRPSST